MNRKLTLSLDSNVVDFAHAFSKKYNKPISKIVENYFQETQKTLRKVLLNQLRRKS
jgi:hypothetical protein